MISERMKDFDWNSYHPFPHHSPGDPSSWDELSDYEVGSGLNLFADPLAKERHNGGCNYGFADGHAKWYVWENTIKPPLPGLHNPERIVPPE